MLLAFDLDNTVVTVDHRLPEPIAEAIATARAAGHFVTVLTGRPEFSARPFVDKLGVAPGPFSVNHGAKVFGCDGAVVKERRLGREEVRTILSPSYAPAGVPFSCIIDDTLYVDDPRDPRWQWAHTQNRQVLRFDLERAEFADKIVFGSNGESKRLERRLRDDLPVETYLWGDGYLEITARDADKGAALALIAQLLSVPRAETIAFGDGLNDLTMLRWAGYAVSVGPYAVDAVCAAADEHVDAPEELGVARWLAENLG